MMEPAGYGKTGPAVGEQTGITPKIFAVNMLFLYFIQR